MAFSPLPAIWKTCTSLVAVGVMCLVGSFLFAQAPAQPRWHLPAYTTNDRQGGHTARNIESSFGFFFETTTNLEIDGLGFASQQAWGNGTSYIVKLWSFDNGGRRPSDYTELASQVFTQGQPYAVKDGYVWAPMEPVILAESLASDPGQRRGYVIAAIGDFSNAPGNVQYESGTPVFDPSFLFVGDGFNDASDRNGFFAIPIYHGNVRAKGYFNPNVSIASGRGLAHRRPGTVRDKKLPATKYGQSATFTGCVGWHVASPF
jgi:hypothetical protein